jgi:hypothetical protein
VSSVSYKKARTQEAEVEPCRLISASPLDDFARESACSFFRRNIQGDQKGSVHLMITIQSLGAQRLFVHPVAVLL